MFRFFLNKKNTSLYPNSNMAFRVDNPAFDADFVFRQWASAFALPEGGNTVSAQGASSPNAEVKTGSGSLFVGGFPIDKGIVDIKTRRNDGFDLSYKNDSISFVEQLKKLNINEVLGSLTFMGGFTGTIFEVENVVSGGALLFAAVNINNITFLVGLPLMNIYPFGTTTAQVLADLINNTIGLEDFARIDPANTTHLIFDNWQKYPTFKIENAVGVTVIASETPGEYMNQQLPAFANNVFANGSDIVCFPTIRMRNAFFDKNQTKNPVFESWINFYENAFEENYRYNTLQCHSVLIPMVYLSYVLNKIGEKLGITITIKDIPEFEKLFFYTNYDSGVDYLDVHDFTPNNVGGFDYTHLVAAPFEIFLDNLVPKMTAHDLLMMLCKSFDLKSDITDTSILLSSKKPNYTRKAIDITKFANREYSIEESVNNGFIVKYKNFDADGSEPSGDLFPVVDGRETYIYDLGFNTLEMAEATAGNGSDYYTPTTTIQLNSKTFGVGSKLDIPILLIYRGVLNNGVNTLYPFSTNHNEDSKRNPWGELSLRIVGDNGLYKKYLDKILPYLVTERKLRKTLNLPIGLLHRIFAEGYFNVWCNHPKGAMGGVIKEMTVRANNRRYGYVECEVDVLLKEL